MIPDVWVHDGTGGPPFRASVEIRDGKFRSITPDRGGPTTSEGTLFHLVPGLIDMHVHVGAVRGKPVPGHAFLERGVTTVRDLGGYPAEVGSAVAADAPHVHAAFQTLNGEARAPFHRVVTTETEVREAVDEQADRGASIIKVHRAFRPELLTVAVDAAARQGLKLTGHIPLRLHPLQACEAGMSGIEHVGSFIEAYVSAVREATQQDAIDYMLSDASEPLYRCLERRHVEVTPTLVLYQSIARSRAGGSPMPVEFSKFIADMKAITRRLHGHGIALLPGTDASALDKPAVSPGVSLIEELELLQSSGLSGAEVMAIAGANAARSLGIASDGRLIAPGLPADFLLIKGDPRTDIRRLAVPYAVYFAGRRVN